jgi:hypothetical protein
VGGLPLDAYNVPGLPAPDRVAQSQIRIEKILTHWRGEAAWRSIVISGEFWKLAAPHGFASLSYIGITADNGFNLDQWRGKIGEAARAEKVLGDSNHKIISHP